MRPCNILVEVDTREERGRTGERQKRRHENRIESKKMKRREIEKRGKEGEMMQGGGGEARCEEVR